MGINNVLAVFSYTHNQFLLARLRVETKCTELKKRSEKNVGEILVIQLCDKLKNKSVKGAELIWEVFRAAVVSWCLQG